MSRLAVVGSANMDLSIVTPRLPEQGETLKCLRSDTSPGGKGANQAVAAARMGSDVWILAKVGEDAFGSSLVSNLQDCGVDTGAIITTREAETGKAFILIYEGDCEIIIDGGSNDKLTAAEIDARADQLVEADGVLLQLEIPLAVVERTVEICKGRTPIFLNPSPAEPLSQSLLQGLDYLTLNEIESAFYTGIKPSDAQTSDQALDLLLGMGIRFPIITLGSKGVAYFNGEKNVHAEGFAVNVVDSTAAGDTFSGALASQISAGVNIDEAIETAQAAAALACTQFGAQNSIPIKKDVEEFLSQYSYRQTARKAA